MIPSVIHQIWLDKPVNPKVQPWMTAVQNSGMTYNLWTNDDVWALFGTTRVDFATYWKLDQTNAVSLSDVLRVLLILKYGGFYIDSDVELKGSLSQLTQYSFVTNIIVPPARPVRPGRKTPDAPSSCVYNEFFGAEVNHPFLQKVLTEMTGSINIPVGFTQRVGYEMFQKCIRSFGSANNVTQLTQQQSDALLTHHFLNSWVEND